MNILKSISLITISLASLNSFAIDDPNFIEVSPKYCKHGLEERKDSNYSLYIFCDDASGTKLGVIHSSPFRHSGDRWTESERFWQEDEWATDVLQIYWNPTRENLFVITSEAYNSNSLYELSLDSKTYKKLLDGKEVNKGLEIESTSETSITVAGREFSLSAEPFNEDEHFHGTFKDGLIDKQYERINRSFKCKD